MISTPFFTYCIYITGRTLQGLSPARTSAMMMAVWKSYRKLKRRSEDLNSLQIIQ